jgi:hypothetical protein
MISTFRIVTVVIVTQGSDIEPPGRESAKKPFKNKGFSEHLSPHQTNHRPQQKKENGEPLIGNNSCEHDDWQNDYRHEHDADKRSKKVHGRVLSITACANSTNAGGVPNSLKPNENTSTSEPARL